MAKVGEVLTAPEQGWKRYDDTNENMDYIGNGWQSLTTISTTYLGTHHKTTKFNDKVAFNFTGSKIRIIGAYNYADSTNIQVVIDGKEYSYSDYASSLMLQVLVFEKMELGLGEHSIVITTLDDDKYFTLDAIDIDENGKLLPYNPEKKSDQTLLRVTMLDSSERDYQLSTTDIEGFINWFNNHTSTSSTSYMLNKKVGTQNSKEYLSFDKIISFEVLELK